MTKTTIKSRVTTGALKRCTGTSIKETLDDVKFDTNQKVVYPAGAPISALGGVIGLQGQLAPTGAIAKVAGMKTLEFEGPARCIGRDVDAFAAVDVGTIRHAGLLKDGDLVTIDAHRGTLDQVTLDQRVPAAEIDNRSKTWKAQAHPYTTGASRKFAAQVGPAVIGAATHAGRKADVVS